MEGKVWRDGGRRGLAPAQSGGGEPTIKAVGGGSGLGNPNAQGCERKKVVMPALRREAAEYLKKSCSVGLRRICGLLRVARSTFYHDSVGRGDRRLRNALKEVALRRRRWGYRMLSLVLKRRGFTDNHKRIYRIYREEGLQVRQRRNRKTAKWRGERPLAATGLNRRRSMDFMSVG